MEIRFSQCFLALADSDCLLVGKTHGGIILVPICPVLLVFGRALCDQKLQEAIGYNPSKDPPHGLGVLWLYDYDSMTITYNLLITHDSWLITHNLTKLTGLQKFIDWFIPIHSWWKHMQLSDSRNGSQCFHRYSSGSDGNDWNSSDNASRALCLLISSLAQQPLQHQWVHSPCCQLSRALSQSPLNIRSTSFRCSGVNEEPAANCNMRSCFSWHALTDSGNSAATTLSILFTKVPMPSSMLCWNLDPRMAFASLTVEAAKPSMYKMFGLLDRQACQTSEHNDNDSYITSYWARGQFI